jgi:hypothetical protein
MNKVKVQRDQASEKSLAWLDVHSVSNRNPSSKSYHLHSQVWTAVRIENKTTQLRAKVNES